MTPLHWQADGKHAPLSAAYQTASRNSRPATRQSRFASAAQGPVRTVRPSDLFFGNAHVWPQLSGGLVEHDLGNVSLDLQRCDTVLQDRVGSNGSSLGADIIELRGFTPQ
jgi:hypothetical protein